LAGAHHVVDPFRWTLPLSPASAPSGDRTADIRNGGFNAFRCAVERPSGDVEAVKDAEITHFLHQLRTATKATGKGLDLNICRVLLFVSVAEQVNEIHVGNRSRSCRSPVLAAMTNCP
jgi:hypothetical protein